MLPKELKDVDAAPEFSKGQKVLYKGKVEEIANTFPLNESEYIYKFKTTGGSKWVEGKLLKPLN